MGGEVLRILEKMSAGIKKGKSSLPTSSPTPTPVVVRKETLAAILEMSEYKVETVDHGLATEGSNVNSDLRVVTWICCWLCFF